MVLLTALLLLAETPAYGAESLQPQMTASQPIVAAIVGDCAQPASYSMAPSATVADLMRVGRATISTDAAGTYGPGVSIVRRGQMMGQGQIGPAVPLQHGDVLLVSPAHQGGARNIAILTQGHAPLVRAIPSAMASTQALSSLLGLSARDGAIQIAPPALSDGSLADGSAVMVPPGDASTRIFNQLVEGSPIYNAVAETAGSQSAAPADILPTVAVADSSMQTAAAPLRAPAVAISLTTPAPPASDAGADAAKATGPMTATRLVTTDPSQLTASSQSAEPDSGKPTSRPVAPFAVHVSISSPTISGSAYPAARAEDMQPEPHHTHAAPGRQHQQSAPLHSSNKNTATAPRSVFADSDDRSFQTAALDGSSILPVSGTAVSSLADLAAAPRSLDVAAARPLAASATPELATIDPTASGLGGVMFAAIVLVVVCGSLVLWSRAGQATPAPLAKASAEMPVTVAPITEEATRPTAPTAMHGDVVGLDKLRIDSAHPISPPHYARTARTASQQTDRERTQDDRKTAATGRQTTAGAPVSGPRFAEQAAAARPTASVASADDHDADQPADVLARALQAMKREQRS